MIHDPAKPTYVSPGGPAPAADVPGGSGDAAWLRQAIDLAAANAEVGQLPFGALVVRDAVVVAGGANTSLRDDDPTAHAEVAAVRAACRRLGTLSLAGATLVSSCEPCALCHAAAAAAGIGRIVYAAPKELAFTWLGAPDGPADDLLVAMQRALRSLAPGQVVHVPVEGAGLPFERFAAAGRST
jgi:guanine deaminase